MYNFFFKRLIDIFLSFIILILLSPLLIIVSLLIFSSMGNPIFFTQKRPGKNKVNFKIYKFRTMIEDPGLDDQKRITKLGLRLRQSSLDELPQLFNVIKGEMSLIGPRPLLVEYNEYFNEEQSLRFKVRPGISGLAQVRGRNYLSWESKFNLDIFYVKNISFKEDFKIFLSTLFIVVSASGFKESGEEKRFSEDFEND